MTLAIAQIVPTIVQAAPERRNVVQPSFTWTVVPANHLIVSVCCACARVVGVSARSELLHFVEHLHHCAAALLTDPPKQPPRAVREPLTCQSARNVRK